MFGDLQWIDPQRKWGSAVHDVAHVEGGLLIA